MWGLDFIFNSQEHPAASIFICEDRKGKNNSSILRIQNDWINYIILLRI